MLRARTFKGLITIAGGHSPLINYLFEGKKKPFQFKLNGLLD